MKKERRNWVGHCYSKLKNHDKLYIVTIRDYHDTKSTYNYEVVCYWGRAGSKLREQSKGLYGKYDRASYEAYDMFTKKAMKGYSDLSVYDPNYTGNLTMDHSYVQPYLVEEEINMLEDDNEFVVVCINNTFIERDFDKDVEYIAKKGVIPRGNVGLGVGQKIQVENRFGEFVVVDSSRFDVSN